MFGKKCTLCGGKLDGNRICTECGLDNSKSDKDYRVNQSSCDDMPLTHVHEEETKAGERKAAAPYTAKKEQKRRQAKQRQPQWTQQSPKPPRRKGKKKLAAIIIIAFIVLTQIGTIGEIIWDLIYEVEQRVDGFGSSDTDSYENETEYDPYEDLTEELPTEGESAEYTLENGEYIVGVHLPPGNYEAEVQDDFDTVILHDYEHSLYLFEYVGKGEKNYLDDLRLFAGAKVRIDAENPVRLTTQNAQTQEMSGTENPLAQTAQSVSMESGDTYKAGKDFEAGVYDITVTKGIGTVPIVIFDENGEEYYSNSIYLTEKERSSYKNLVLPQGAEISVDDDDMGDEWKLEITLTPSEIIASTDYMQHYKY